MASYDSDGDCTAAVLGRSQKLRYIQLTMRHFLLPSIHRAAVFVNCRKKVAIALATMLIPDGSDVWTRVRLFELTLTSSSPIPATA